MGGRDCGGLLHESLDRSSVEFLLRLLSSRTIDDRRESDLLASEKGGGSDESGVSILPEMPESEPDFPVVAFEDKESEVIDVQSRVKDGSVCP